MKPARGALDRMLDKPNRSIRFYLFYGPDESQSRAHAERLLRGLGAEKAAVSAQAAKSDPAILADEAAAIGLFGGTRAIWVEPAGDEIAPAADALLGATSVESAVVAVAGALRKTSALVKLAETHPQALAQVSYELGERDAEQVVQAFARNEGLRLGPGFAARIASAAGNDRGVLSQELAKIALYVGASPDNIVDVDASVLDAIGSGGEGDSSRLVDLALSGDMERLSGELDASAGDTEPISLIRALQRRLLMLAPIRARVDKGDRPHDAVTSAGKAVFFKEKDVVAGMVARWESHALARVLQRSGELERRLMSSESPPPIEALEEELLAIARTAQRR